MADGSDASPEAPAHTFSRDARRLQNPSVKAIEILEMISWTSVQFLRLVWVLFMALLVPAFASLARFGVPAVVGAASATTADLALLMSPAVIAPAT